MQKIENDTIMLMVVGVMLCGVVFGFLLRRRKLGFVQPLITVAIWLLLFLLGLSVGADPVITEQFGMIGWEAFVLTGGAVAGSVGCAWLVYRYVYAGKCVADRQEGWEE